MRSTPNSATAHAFTPVNREARSGQLELVGPVRESSARRRPCKQPSRSACTWHRCSASSDEPPPRTLRAPALPADLPDSRLSKHRERSFLGPYARTIAALPALIARQMIIPRTVQPSHASEAEPMNLASRVPRSGLEPRHPLDATRFCIRHRATIGRITTLHVTDRKSVV